MVLYPIVRVLLSVFLLPPSFFNFSSRVENETNKDDVEFDLIRSVRLPNGPLAPEIHRLQTDAALLFAHAWVLYLAPPPRELHDERAAWCYHVWAGAGVWDA